MVSDIGTFKQRIKPKADSTLLNMRKADLVEYIRCLEHNYNVAVEFNENQARYIESLDTVEVIKCKDCANYQQTLGKDSGKLCGYGSCRNPCAMTGIVYDEDYCSYGERREYVLPLR